MTATLTPLLQFPTAYPVQVYWLECVGFEIVACHREFISLRNEDGVEVDIIYPTKRAIISIQEQIIGIEPVEIPNLNNLIFSF